MAAAENDLRRTSHAPVLAVPCNRYLSPAGEAVRALPAFAESPETLIALYRAMVLTRLFDDKAVALQRTGRLGTYASSLGQEAVGVGVASAMQADDVLLPSFREHGAHALARRHPDGAAALLGRRRARQRLPGPAPRLSRLRAGRHPVPACRRRRPCLQAAARAARRGCALAATAPRRRATSTRRSTSPASGSCRSCSSSTTTMGDLGAALGADRRRDAGAEGHRRGHRRRAGRRQRRHRGARGSASAAIARRAAARADADRGPDLPPRRPHHRRRRPPLPRDAEVSAHWKEEPIARLRSYLVARGVWDKAGRGRACCTELSRRDRRGCRELSGDAAAAADRHVRSSLRRAAGPRSQANAPLLAARRMAAMPEVDAGRGRQSGARARDGRGRRACSCSARTSAPTAACSAPPRACSTRFGAGARARHAAGRDRDRRHRRRAWRRRACGRSPRSSSTASCYPTIDQMVNHAARLRTARAAGSPARWCCARRTAAASTRPSTIPRASRRCFAHIPGLRVVIPSSPRRAYGLLLAAIRDPDPVVFLEPKRALPRGKEDVDDDGDGLPLDRCFVLRDGQRRHARHLGRDGARDAGRRRRSGRRGYRVRRSSTSPR